MYEIHVEMISYWLNIIESIYYKNQYSHTDHSDIDPFQGH